MSLSIFTVFWLLPLTFSESGYLPKKARRPDLASISSAVEVWRDLSQLPRIQPGPGAFLTSSYCRDGCRFDHHSEDAPKFLRVVEDEGVLFEDRGSGVVTRIWMTMGEQGISTPLDEKIIIRISIDGRVVAELPLPDFFGGAQPPFLFPLVGDRDVSGGGNYCYVPLTYRDHCRISLLNAGDKRIWFQINHRGLLDRDAVSSFPEQGNLRYWSSLLASPGQDPWPESHGSWAYGSSLLSPQAEKTLIHEKGGGIVDALLLEVPLSLAPDLVLRCQIDGETRIEMPVADFFATGNRFRKPTRSLLLGLDEAFRFYCYFPMPYFQDMRIQVADPAGVLSEPQNIAWQIRRSRGAPPLDFGYFTAIQSRQNRTETQGSIPLFSLEGKGKWVGLFAELGSERKNNFDYLEGDEKLYLDGEAHASSQGTGVEDFFGGGFYFRDESLQPQPFGLALHGMSYSFLENGESTTAMYRLMPTDAFPFVDGIRVELEAGPTNDTAMRANTVAYFYLQPIPERRAAPNRDSRFLPRPSLAGATPSLFWTGISRALYFRLMFLNLVR